MRSIGAPIRRVDGNEKAQGSARYLADIVIPGVQIGRFVLSDRAPATVISITAPPLPAGSAFVTARDVPAINGVHMIDESWPLFADPAVEYIGQPIAMIVGPDPAVIDKLVEETVVEYGPPAPGPDGETPTTPLSFPDALSDRQAVAFAEYSLEFERSADEMPNAAGEEAADSTDSEAGTAMDAAATGRAPGPDARSPSLSAPLRLTEAFETGAQEHVYLEPQSMAAEFSDGHLTVRGSMQCPYYVKTALEMLTGLSARQVRVVQDTTGGGFGGKEEFPSVIACAVAVAAMKTGKPVRMILDRDEDVRISTKRHPSRIRFDSEISQGGVWTGSNIDIALDAGAYEGLSGVVLQRSLFGCTGAYRIGRASIRARALKTHVVPFGAFRGFGAPQAVFAVEMHLNHLALARGEDPLTFKRRHLLKQNDHTVTRGLLRDPVKLEEMIDLAVEMADYPRRRREYDRPGQRGGSGSPGRTATNRMSRGAAPLGGIGVSIFPHGCGFTGSGEQNIIKARVDLRRHPDGLVEILVANVEMGQGALTTLRKIVARVLDIPLDRVVYRNPDTAEVPDSGPTVASRTSMVVGRLLYQAAERLKTMPMPADPEKPQTVTERYQQPDFVQWNQETFQGDAYPAFSWGINIVEVEVDPLTYVVRPTHVWAVYDVGDPLDEQIVVGQMHGGIVQGLGWATSEVLEVNEGRFLQHNLTDYVVPGASDVPPIDVRFVSNPYDLGPFGAKGAGELPFHGPAPALAAAVEQALGKNVYRIPLTPEYLETIVREENRS